MNNTLRKYELMKELGIDIDRHSLHGCWTYDGMLWYEGDNVVTDYAVAAILERACREWLEKQYILIMPYHGKYWIHYNEAGVRKKNEFYLSYDAAQIAALEYCLKERK